MKILWIVNTVIPQIAKYCGITESVGGGWLSAFFASIKSNKDYNITVCFPYNKTSLFNVTNNVTCISFLEKASNRYFPSLETFFNNVISTGSFDIIHVFGTEFPHTLAAVKACQNNNVLGKCIVSIQGLIHACAEKYYAGLPKSVIYKFSLRDFLKADNVYFQKKRFEKRGEYEILTLKIAKNVIGRTSWDYSSVKKINNSINYYFCNESLRIEFYAAQKWDYDKCEKHSVFITQSYYPLKGFHNLISVFAKLVKKYPDIHIYTTGNGGNYGNFVSNLKHKTYYQKYLIKMIKKYNLKNRITFLGDLNAEQMRDRLLKSNAFVLPSSLENSPNSLGEAMLLGVPCICSDVGGVRTLIKDSTEGYIYPFDHPDIAGTYIEKVFSDKENTKTISENAVKHAEITHSISANEERLKRIYSLISEG